MGKVIICIAIIAGITSGALDPRWFAAFIWETGTATVVSADRFVRDNQNNNTYPYNSLGNLGGSDE